MFANVRESLAQKGWADMLSECVADWLGWQDESLSFGLRSEADAIKLYNHFQKHPDTLPEFADEYIEEGDFIYDPAVTLVAVLGYNPFTEAVNQ